MKKVEFRSGTAIDLIVYALVLVLGIFAVSSHLRTSDVVNDATYIDIARSILEKGSYQFNSHPETLFPPGFPLLLALVSAISGSSLAAMYELIAVTTILGLIASYELLRRLESRALAAAAILLLGASPALFAFTTQLIFSDMPYFFASLFSLLLAFKTDHARRGTRIALMVLLSIFLVAAVMIRSSGIALILALGAWIGAPLLANPAHRWKRALFLIPFVLAVGAQLLWTEWASYRSFEEWPVPGYPGSYISQLKVKNGHYPEMGIASPRDIPGRIANNLENRTAEFVQLLTGIKWIDPKWCSPAVFGVFALILMGLASSFWREGGQLHDWYFLFYEFIFAIWPWDFEMRFLLPVVPLACLYLWRGGKMATALWHRWPRITGVVSFSVGLLLLGPTAVWAAGTRSLQSILSIVIWGCFAIAGLCAARWRPFDKVTGLIRGVLPVSVRPAAFTVIRTAALSILVAVIAVGASIELQVARENTSFMPSAGRYYPDIEAAQWIRAHAPTQWVVMARKEDLVYHYSRHPVIWLPPLSKPAVLMNGIRKYQVRLIVVVDRDEEYFMPTQEVCFQALQHSYGSSFHLVHKGPGDSIFAVGDAAGMFEPD